MINTSTQLRIQVPLDERYSRASDEELKQRILDAKKSLGKELIILGHHYQRDEVIEFADSRGDSYKLARFAAENAHAKHIIFCGVHFMAESADVLTEENQQIYLPDLNAGCSMADMASNIQVLDAWEMFSSFVDEDSIMPITYMNSSAAIKSFVGEHGGAVCTSSNAKEIIEWGLKDHKHILFIPDQHLGRNSAFQMGYDEDDIFVYDPRASVEKTKEEIASKTFWLWKGHCSVHQRFSTEHVDNFRKENPNGIVVVHPETKHEVVEAADVVGSTEKIIDYVKAAPAGSVIGVGTEVHLVQRLAKEHSDKKIVSLDPLYCPCSTMFRIDLPHLAWCIENIVDGHPVNEIKVDSTTRKWARISLQRMLDITERK
ncbi:MAG: quinolinate synthase NadA [Acidimicrobiia bacterium]